MTRIFERIEQAKRFNEHMEGKGPENELSEDILCFAQMLVSGTFRALVSTPAGINQRCFRQVEEQLQTCKRRWQPHSESSHAFRR